VFRILPSIMLAERYDSNVFFTPSIPGIDPEDFVTTVSPRIQVEQRGGPVDGIVRAGATAEHYVKNSELDYVGFDGSGSLDLTRLVQRRARGWSFQVTDSFNFTNQPAAFLTVEPVTGTTPGQQTGTPLPVADNYVRGVQAARVDTLTNTASTAIGYQLSPITRLQASYSYSLIRFGQTYVAQTQGSFFDSDTHSAAILYLANVSRTGTMSLGYSYQYTDYGLGLFETHAVTVGWGKAFSPTLTGNLTGGAALVKQEGAFFDGTTAPGIQYAPNGSLTVSWRHGTTRMNLSYTGGVFPSYYLSAGPLMSHVVNVDAGHDLTPNLSLSIGANYARNDALDSGAGNFFFESFATNAGVNYQLTPTLQASVTHTFAHFSGTFFGGANEAKFIRNTVMLGLRKSWSY
jgi:hypothetical protein